MVAVCWAKMVGAANADAKIVQATAHERQLPPRGHATRGVTRVPTRVMTFVVTCAVSGAAAGVMSGVATIRARRNISIGRIIQRAARTVAGRRATALTAGFL